MVALDNMYACYYLLLDFIFVWNINPNFEIGIIFLYKFPFDGGNIAVGSENEARAQEQSVLGVFFYIKYIFLCMYINKCMHNGELAAEMWKIDVCCRLKIIIKALTI